VYYDITVNHCGNRYGNISLQKQSLSRTVCPDEPQMCIRLLDKYKLLFSEPHEKDEKMSETAPVRLMRAGGVISLRS
jgi:hypothetical protein